MPTKLDGIAALLTAALVTADEAKLMELLEAMCDYEEEVNFTFQHLNRIPAFVKLWNAILDAGERE